MYRCHHHGGIILDGDCYESQAPGIIQDPGGFTIQLDPHRRFLLPANWMFLPVAGGVRMMSVGGRL